MSDRLSALHNELALDFVTGSIRAIIDAGGHTEDVMVLTESVLVAAALYCIRLGGDEEVLDAMMTRAKGRLAEIRLRDIETKGSA